MARSVVEFFKSVILTFFNNSCFFNLSSKLALSEIIALKIDYLDIFKIKF